MKSKTKKFLNLPEYPGGKEGFRKYIRENLKYPKKALESKVEGIVYLSAEISDNGNVLSVKVENGLGYGCDDEAIRLLKNIQFGGVKNRGVRVKAKKRFKIEFKLPPQPKVNFSVTKKKNVDNEQTTKKSYSYTIQIK